MNSLGALTVRLGLDASEYVRGFTKAEAQARQFAQNTRRAIADVAGVLGSLEIGRQVLENTKAIIEQAASLNDLADATGSSVENLSRLSNQAQIAGTDFSALQSLVLKLSAGMAGADDETSKVGAALKYLGVTTKDPVEALQQVAVKMNQYADGVGKAGIAVALFGKQGPAFVATLKDIAELQDVGATVSAKQAAEAENLEKAYRRLSVEATGFRNAVLSDMVPALTALIGQMQEGIRVAGSLGQGFEAFTGVISRSGSTADRIREVTAELANLREQANRDYGPFKSLTDLRDLINPDRVGNLTAQLAILRARQRQEALAIVGPGIFDARDLKAQQKPTLDFVIPKDGKSLKEQISDAQRYIESLEKQLQGTLELTEAEKAAVAIYDIRHKALQQVSADEEARIFDMARQIDAAKEAARAEQERLRAEQDAMRIRERTSQEITRQIEHEQQAAQQIRDQNEALQEQLVFLRSGEEGLRAYTDAKLAKSIAELEDKAAMLENADASQAVIDAIRQQADALRQRQEIIAQTQIAEQMKKEADAIRQAQEQVFDLGANALADFVNGTKSAKDALRSFLNDLQHFLTSQALLGIKSGLFGGQGAGTDIFSLLLKGIPWVSGAGGVAGIGGFSGGNNGEHFASGGISRGGLTLVGEHGPELVNLRRGSQVYSAPETKRLLGYGRERTFSIVQHINVLPGASTASAKQAAGFARDRVMSAIRDR